MNRLRFALAAGALAVAAAPFATSNATAMACHPDFQIVCVVIGTACQAVDDLPKVECPRLG